MVRMVEKRDSFTQDSTELIVKVIGGGNIIDRRPVYSADSKNLFVVHGATIQSYSVKTGELVQEYDSFDSNAIGVQIHPHDDQVLVACSAKGELKEWKWQTRLPGKKMKLSLPDKKSEVHGFYLIKDSSSNGNQSYNVLAIHAEGKANLTTSLFFGKSGKFKKYLGLRLANHSHSLAYGSFDGEEFFAGINENVLIVMRQSDLYKKRHIIEKHNHFTCVACHHERQIVATGDSLGRVHVWYNSLKGDQPKTTIYHWHQLPVRDIVFSQAGSFFYSGGGECVLVKWTLDSPSNKSFLPRLPAPVRHLSMGPDNQYVGVSTDDNAIQVIDPHRKITTVIQHLTWGVTVGLDREPFAAGITLDPRTKTLVLNGRVGHIQFFSPVKKSLLYNLDITGQNYMSQELNRVIVNTDVTATALSCDGLWLATLEERDDHETSLESRLKFWQYSLTKREYTLNTCVDMPHDGPATSVQFRPTSDPAQLLAVTVGTDCKFRLWSVTSNNSLTKPGKLWQCESVGFHKNLPTGDTSFSADGSLLAVSFSASLTVWLPETNQLKSSLTHFELDKPIRYVEFGRKESSHMVVTASETYISVWNLLSLSLVWVVDVNVSLLAADPFSEFLAVFTKDNSVFVFTANLCQFVYSQKNVTDDKTKILAAAFVPRSTPNVSHERSWLSLSQLYFINSNQEMLTLDTTEDYVDVELLNVLPGRSNTPMTPFAALMAKQSSSAVEKLKPMPQPQLGVAGASTVQEFINSPAHTMPSLTILCDSFLRSFAVAGNSTPEIEAKQKKMDVDSENEDNEVQFGETKTTQPSVVNNDFQQEKKLEPLLNQSYDWVTKFINGCSTPRGRTRTSNIKK